MQAPAEAADPTRLGILIASLKVGGAERAALGLLAEFRRAGVDAYLLALDRNREMFETVQGEARELLAPCIVGLSGADIRWRTVSKVLVGPWQWLALERAVRRLDRTMILSIMERANIMSLLTLAPRRRILSVRSYPSELLSSKSPLKRFLVLRLYRLLLRRADRIVFVSREAAADFARLFPETSRRSSVIYNACDVDGMRRLARSPLPSGFESVFEHPVVIACGRMSPEKGHWELVRAFGELSRRDPEVRLVIVGTGPLERDLARLCHRLGIAERVVFPGFQSNPLAWIARARVFVLPSAWEGFPNSLLEALACGVPVVASDCRSGPRELLAPETDATIKTDRIERTPCGFLVPPPGSPRPGPSDPLTREEHFFAEAIERLLRDDGLRKSQAEAASRRVSEFKPDRIIPRWLALFRELS